MQEILIDGSELVLENGIEMANDLRIALHGWHRDEGKDGSWPSTEGFGKSTRARFEKAGCLSGDGPVANLGNALFDQFTRRFFAAAAAARNG
jgi:hypothetical protein